MFGRVWYKSEMYVPVLLWPNYLQGSVFCEVNFDFTEKNIYFSVTIGIADIDDTAPVFVNAEDWEFSIEETFGSQSFTPLMADLRQYI